MKILPLNNQNFQAKVHPTLAMNDFVRYMEINSGNKPPYYNTMKQLNLVTNIVDAFTMHPSPVVVYPEVIYRKGELFNARGVLNCSNGTSLVDVEPARSDSGTAPLCNIFRKIFDPDNKVILDKIFGNEYSKETAQWYDLYIAPMWKHINENFREYTIPIRDYALNKSFVELNMR